MGRTLFKKVADAERRTIPLRVWVNADEEEAIGRAAAIRQLDRSEYIRRAALGRRADVRYETETVLALIAVVQIIRDLRAALIDHGIAPQDDILRPVIIEARDAMLRIDK